MYLTIVGNLKTADMGDVWLTRFVIGGPGDETFSSANRRHTTRLFTFPAHWKLRFVVLVGTGLLGVVLVLSTSKATSIVRNRRAHFRRSQ